MAHCFIHVYHTHFCRIGYKTSSEIKARRGKTLAYNAEYISASNIDNCATDVWKLTVFRFGVAVLGDLHRKSLSLIDKFTARLPKSTFKCLKFYWRIREVISRSFNASAPRKFKEDHLNNLSEIARLV